MLNAIYKLGKLDYKRKNPTKEEEEKNRIFTLIDSNKLGKVKKVLFVNITINDNEYEYNKTIIENCQKDNYLKYLYKFGSPAGTDITPSSKITTPKKTWENKVFKWFENELKNENEENMIIHKVGEAICKDKDKILSDINQKYQDISSGNVLLSINFTENGKIKYLNDYKVFKDILIKKSEEKYYKKSYGESKGKSSCYLCNKYKEVYGYVPTTIDLTFNTPQKRGNIPEFEYKNQWKQTGICGDCAFYLEAGKKFIDKYLKFSENGFNFYVIPKFNKEEVFDKIYPVLEELKNEKGNFSENIAIEEEFMKIAKDMNAILKLDFLYYKEVNSSFKIIKYIEDVLPSRLFKIYEAQKKVKLLDFFDEDHMHYYFGKNFDGSFVEKKVKNSNSWYLEILKDFIFDENVKYNQKKSYYNVEKDYLEIINSVIYGNISNYDLFLKIGMDNIRKSWRNDKSQYKVKEDLFKFLHLITFFNELDLLKEDDKMVIDDNIKCSKDILDKLNSADEKACFLVGALVKSITFEQYKNLGSKPFTNKLYGLNIDYDKLKEILRNAINKTIEYDIEYKYNNKIIELVGSYLYESNNNWSLNKNNTSYYFTLGYILGYNKIKEDVNNE